jgi:pimeloyl-ACP methyl ester carboxylesterase
MTIFTSLQAKKQLMDWQDQFRARIGLPTESCRFSTRLGETHALFCGPSEAPPLVCLHGAMSNSAQAMLGAAPLADAFRLIAPDVVGQSPMSAETRPDVNGPAYGEWLADVFDALKLERACVMGASWGGLIALRGAVRMPHRIQKLSLIVPPGIVQGPILKAFFKIGWPMMRYRSSPTKDRLDRFLENLITTRDPDWEAYLGDAVRGFKLDTKPLRLVKQGDLSALKAPVQVLAAELDFQSPGRKLIAQAKAIIPSLSDTVLIPQSHHALPFDDAFRSWLAGEVRRFLLGRPQS